MSRPVLVHGLRAPGGGEQRPPVGAIARLALGPTELDLQLETIARVGARVEVECGAYQRTASAAARLVSASSPARRATALAHRGSEGFTACDDMRRDGRRRWD